MIRTTTMQAGDRDVIGVEVELPNTRLVIITTERGYIMCGALDVGVLDERLAARKIVAGRAFGIRSCEDLLDAPLESVTNEARLLGIVPGMTGREALIRMD